MWNVVGIDNLVFFVNLIIIVVLLVFNYIFVVGKLKERFENFLVR